MTGTSQNTGSQEKWRSCRFPPSAKACDFEPGDGVGAGGRGSETYVGHADSEHACIQAVRAGYPAANGATFSSQAPGACTPTAEDDCHRCYAETGMEHADGSPGWITCKLEATNLHTTGHMSTANVPLPPPPFCPRGALPCSPTNYLTNP